MKILIFTQKVNKDDSTLGFFHDWIKEIAQKVETIEVVCLEKGEFNLPRNVTVYSLGKENNVSKITYVFNFYKYLFSINGSYDKVFVHMNQEYVLLAGLYWKIKGIPVYLWRNHPDGSLLTYIAASFSTKVFCTSTKSFTARFKKTVIMPAGINTELFKPVSGVVRKKYSVCMVGRLAPIKHNELALEALKILTLQGVQVSLSFIGEASLKDNLFYENLRGYVEENNLSTFVNFEKAVPPDKLPEIYSGFEICLNLTESGSFDKTIVEAASCGAIPLVSNVSFKGLLPESCITEDSPESIAQSIQKLLVAHEQIEIQDELQNFVKSQSLTLLVDRLISQFKNV